MKLDNFQEKAVNSEERNVLVVAAPGSGKTTVIIYRINYIIEKVNIDERNIILLTFTKSAALNMKDRYIKSFKRNKTPFFGTFHGLFYKILLRENKKINIIEGYICKKIVESVLKKYFDEINEDKVKEAINNISLFKTSRLTLEEFNPSFSKEIFSDILISYNTYKEENNLWDFDDLAIETLNLLKNNEKLRKGYQKLFKYLLVDEFQDCDELQIEFLKIINDGEDNSLFAVGDEDQCIYSFRGSKPEYMVTYNKIFKESKKYFLSTNYRSRKNIVECSKKVIDNNKNRNKKEILWNNTNEGNIKYMTPVNERIQGEEIAKEIKMLTEQGKDYKDNIILYRTNIESNSIIDALIRNKVPFSLLDKEYNFYNHFVCRDLLNYLALANNLKNREAFMKVINKPFRYISKISLSYVREYKEDLDPFKILIEKESTPPFQKKKLEEIKKDLAYIKKSSLNTAIQTIITDLQYINYLKDYSEKFSSSIEDLEDVIESFKLAASSFKTINDFFIHIEEVKDSIENSKRDKDGDRVKLSTIHGVKGMEFGNVFIINCMEDTIPHSSSKDTNLEEERRLFYVGITRAINNIYLYAPRMKGIIKKEPSRFIKEGDFYKETIKTIGFEEKARVYHLTYKEGEIEKINEDEITILFDNGVSRRFSFKVLMDNNLIKPIST